MAPAPPPHTSPTWVGAHGASGVCVGPQRLAIAPTHTPVHAHPVAAMGQSLPAAPQFWTAHSHAPQVPPTPLARPPSTFPTPLGLTWRGSNVAPMGGTPWVRLAPLFCTPSLAALTGHISRLARWFGMVQGPNFGFWAMGNPNTASEPPSHSIWAELPDQDPVLLF